MSKTIVWQQCENDLRSPAVLITEENEICLHKDGVMITAPIEQWIKMAQLYNALNDVKQSFLEFKKAWFG